MPSAESVEGLDGGVQGRNGLGAKGTMGPGVMIHVPTIVDGSEDAG